MTKRIPAILLFSVMAISTHAQSVTVEAESGTLGSDMATDVDGAVTFIHNINNNTSSDSPGVAGRVASYAVDFPGPGSYNLYARIRVGSGGYDDDSLFVASGFGSKTPDAAADWLRLNGLSSGGYSGASDIVDGDGSEGNNVWKWVNVSLVDNGSSDPQTTYSVSEGSLSNVVFQIGGREDGLDIDKLVFGLANNVFTVSELDAGGPGTAPPPPPLPPDVVSGNLIQFNENGAWCWYQDERAIYDPNTDRLILGSVASGAGTGGSSRDAAVESVLFDLGDRIPQRLVLTSSAYSYTDDHNAPAFLLWPDGRVTAQYAGHNNDRLSRFRILDGDTWQPETRFDWASVGAGSGEETSYSNPHYMSAEGRAYTFVRCIDNRSPNILVSEDQGVTWSYAGQLVKPDGAVGYNSGYFRYSGNGIDRIDFICTEGHPRDLQTSIYHGYISNGKSYRSDGTIVDDDIFDNSYIPVSSDFTQVFAHGTEIFPGTTIYRLWNSDVQYYPDGTVEAIIHGRINNNTGGNDSGIDPNHAFFFCRWDGSSWTSTYLCQAGTKMYSSEADYVGLGAMSPTDPSTIFLSTRYDPRAVIPGEADGNPPFAAKREIWKGVTLDDGASFTWTQVTSNSVVDNFRPVVPVWNEDNIALLWFRGVYNSAQSFDASIVGLVERRAEESSLMTYIDATTENTTLAGGGALVTGAGSGQWHLRSGVGNAGDLLASADAVAEDAPALATTVAVPEPGIYDLWVNFWGDPVGDGNDWRIKAGLSPDRMQVYRQVASKSVDAGYHDSDLMLADDDMNYLYQAYVGRTTVTTGSTITVYVDDHPVVTGSTGTLVGNSLRTWYDGISYARVGDASPLMIQEFTGSGSGPDTVSLTWNSQPPESMLAPQTYMVERTDALTNETWTTLSTGIPSAGETSTFTDDSPLSGEAFYRIRRP